MAISINNLKIFVAVVDNENNITLTAEKLYISQPAISKAIKNIETELNIQLFHRSKRSGLTLTPIGKKILNQVRTLLYEEEKIYQTAHNENHLLEGTLRIASIPLHTYPFIGTCINIFKKKFPSVHIEYHEATTKKVKEKVASYEVDFGITVYPFEEFKTITLYDDSMVAFSLSDLHKKEFNFHKDHEKVMVCQSGLEVIQPVLEEIHLYHPEQFEIYSSPMTVKTFVEQGLGIGIVSKSFLDPLDHYHIYPVKPFINSEAAIIFNQYNDLSPAAREFLQIVDHQISQQKKSSSVQKNSSKR